MDKLKRIHIIIFLFITLLLTACSKESQDHIRNVGMIFTNDISDQPWDLKGYEGLQNIGEQYGVDIFYEENVTNQHEIIDVVDDFARKGTNLIFGHGHIYGRTFVEIADEFPGVHFVYLGGGYFDENVTSLNINAHAMSFFAGMIASKMSQTNQVGIIASYEWQPEIEGFYEGVKYENSAVNVNIDILNERHTQEQAIHIYDKIKQKEVDVIYPVIDAYSKDLIERAQEDDIYSIGYLVDAQDIGGDMVLTSTIQHIDQLYEHAAKRFNEDGLEGGLLTFDFQDDVISLGPFNEDIPKDYQSLIQQLIVNYKDMKQLPVEH